MFPWYVKFKISSYLIFWTNILIFGGFIFVSVDKIEIRIIHKSIRKDFTYVTPQKLRYLRFKLIFKNENTYLKISF